MVGVVTSSPSKIRGGKGALIIIASGTGIVGLRPPALCHMKYKKTLTLGKRNTNRRRLEKRP